MLILAWLSPRTVPVRLALAQFFVFGVLSLFTGLVLETITVQALVSAAVPIFYGGVCSVGAGYTLQTVVFLQGPSLARGHSPQSGIAFAALGGWLLLHEVLSGWHSSLG